MLYINTFCLNQRKQVRYQQQQQKEKKEKKKKQKQQQTNKQETNKQTKKKKKKKKKCGKIRLHLAQITDPRFFWATKNAYERSLTEAERIAGSMYRKAYFHSLTKPIRAVIYGRSLVLTASDVVSETAKRGGTDVHLDAELFCWRWHTYSKH